MLAEPTLEDLRELYARMRTIAVVGCSSDPLKPANYVPRYLRAYGYRIVPVNPRATELLGEPCRASLLDVEEPVDVVQVFRPEHEAVTIVAEALAIRAGCMWLQLGLRSDEAGRIARAAGMMFVMDRCMGVVHGQLGLGPGLHLGDEWHRGLDPVAVRTASDQPVLRATAGPAAGRTFATTRELVLGRGENLDGNGEGRIADDPELSRRHARISRNAGYQVMIEDLGSTNGTYVNGARVTEQVLSIGDTIQLGTTTLELATPTASPALSAVHDRTALAQATSLHVLPALRAGDATALRSEFPVFERVAYLNAGSDGPVPRRALEAASARMGLVLAQGRAGDEHARQLRSLDAALRRRYAAALGCDVDEVALTGSTSDGINTVLAGLHLRRRDEILTSDEEQLSMLAPLAAIAKRYGVDVRTVPFDQVAGEVGPRTRLVACSHVSWISGRVANVEAIVAAGAPLLLDGAQALAAIAVDVRALGCDYYAASGQKWLCGPDGSGCLFVRRDRLQTLTPPWPSMLSLGDAQDPSQLVFHASARRFDTAPVSGPLATWALAAMEVLDDAGPAWIHERGPTLAQTLAARLRERGLTVAPRGPSTLVSWVAQDPEATVARLADAGVVVRSIVARGLVRASVGAWNDAEDLARLVAAAA